MSGHWINSARESLGAKEDEHMEEELVWVGMGVPVSQGSLTLFLCPALPPVNIGWFTYSLMEGRGRGSVHRAFAGKPVWKPFLASTCSLLGGIHVYQGVQMLPIEGTGWCYWPWQYIYCPTSSKGLIIPLQGDIIITTACLNSLTSILCARLGKVGRHQVCYGSPLPWSLQLCFFHLHFWKLLAVWCCPRATCARVPATPEASNSVTGIHAVRQWEVQSQRWGLPISCANCTASFQLKGKWRNKKSECHGWKRSIDS